MIIVIIILQIGSLMFILLVLIIKLVVFKNSVFDNALPWISQAKPYDKIFYFWRWNLGLWIKRARQFLLFVSFCKCIAHSFWDKKWLLNNKILMSN